MRSEQPGSLFDLTSFFDGRTTAWGVFEDRFGRLCRRFTIEMNGSWKNGVFHLDETFQYDTGESEQRTWLVSRAADGRFTASCPDCVGSAHGQADSNSTRMNYRFKLKVNARSFIVRFDDRIYRMDAGTAVNRATMSKWGIKLGELSLFFRRDGF